MNLALFISGGASTACTIIDSCFHGKLNGLVTPALVIASHDTVPGIANINKLCAWGRRFEDIVDLDPKLYCSTDEYGVAILRECTLRNINFIGLYGFMEKLPKNVINEFKGRSVNQHPAPLDPGYPDFGGMGVHGIRTHFIRLTFVRQVKRDYWTEATAHRIEEEIDTGIVVNRRQMEINPLDTPDSVQKRLLPIEHELQIDTLCDFARGKVREFSRHTRLVKPGEESILAECKKYASLTYPYIR